MHFFNKQTVPNTQWHKHFNITTFTVFQTEILKGRSFLRTFFQVSEKVFFQHG
jgi:hypothetical protein